MPPVYGGAAAPLKENAPIYELSDRFSDRARALFYARLAFLSIGLGVLAVPSWSQYLGTTTSTAFAVYFFAIGYSVTNYLLLDHPAFGRALTFCTLVLDLAIMTAMISASGGLASPMMAGQIMFTIFFALLYPRFIAVLPPMFVLPIVAWLDASGDQTFLARDLFILVWYGVLDLVAIYVLLYLNARDRSHLMQLRELSSMREVSLITEERLRLSREIHDGLGGELSTLIIQSEFIYRLAKDEELKKEIADLKTQAEDAIDELRRSLTMMRRDFDLHKSLEEYVARFESRAKVPCDFKILGRRRRLPSDMQLALFRILQECLTNVHKHAGAKTADAKLKYDGDLVSLTITDDGVGFDTTGKHPGHYGLINMTERAKKWRGTVSFQSAPGAGTSVHVTLVIPQEGSHVAVLPPEPNAAA